MPALSIITMISLPCIASFLRAIYIFIVFVSVLLVPLVAAIPHPISRSSLDKAANASSYGKQLHSNVFSRETYHVW